MGRVNALMSHKGEANRRGRSGASSRQVQHFDNGCLNFSHQQRGTDSKRPRGKTTIVDGAQLIDQKIGIVLQFGERLDTEPQRFRIFNQVGRKWNDQR